MQWALCSVVHCSSRHTISARWYYSTCTILFSTLSFHILCLFSLCGAVLVRVSECVCTTIFWIMRFYFFYFIFHSILIVYTLYVCVVCFHFSRVGFLLCHVWSLKCSNSNKPKCFQGTHFSQHIDDDDDIDYNDGSIQKNRKREKS